MNEAARLLAICHERREMIFELRAKVKELEKEKKAMEFELMETLEGRKKTSKEMHKARKESMGWKKRAEKAEEENNRLRDALEKIASVDPKALIEFFAVGRTAPELSRCYEEIAQQALKEKS